jgi:hypothetical protein
MIDQELFTHINHIKDRLNLMENLNKRTDVTWSKIALDVVEGDYPVDSIPRFSSTELSIIDEMEHLLSNRDMLLSSFTYELLPPGSYFSYLSLSPLLCLSRIFRGDQRAGETNKLYFKHEANVVNFLDETTYLRPRFNKRQRNAWSFDFAEIAAFLFRVRMHYPELFIMLISREYDLAERKYPWLLQSAVDNGNEIVVASFDNLKCTPATAMRIVGMAQRFREIVDAMRVFKNVTPAFLRDISSSEGNENIADHISDDPGVGRYLNALGTSVLGLHQTLMVDHSHPDRLPTGNPLSIIANRDFVGPYHDQALLGLEENAAKSFLGAIYTELTAKSPVARRPGNNGCGNDDVKRISNNGGHGLRTLNTHYGHTLFPLGCRFGFDTSNAAGMNTRLGTIGALADDMLIEAKLASKDSRDNSARIQATRLEKYKTQLTDQDFGSTTAMVNFEIQRWTDPTADAASWIGLAENTVAATPEQGYFLIVRRYLSSFFFEASRLREAELAAKVWAHLSHAVTSFSRDAIWTLIRNQELSDLGITHKAVRAVHKTARAAQKEKTFNPFSHVNEDRGKITFNPTLPRKGAITVGDLGGKKTSDELERGFSDSRNRSLKSFILLRL